MPRKLCVCCVDLPVSGYMRLHYHQNICKVALELQRGRPISTLSRLTRFQTIITRRSKKKTETLACFGGNVIEWFAFKATIALDG